MRSCLRYALFCLLLLATATQAQQLELLTAKTPNAFPLISPEANPALLIDPADARVVGISANAFAGDYGLLTENKNLPVLQSANW